MGEDNMWANFQANCRRGFTLVTKYSGMGCCEMACRVINDAVMWCFDATDAHDPIHNCIVSHSATEIDDRTRQVLCSQVDHRPGSCVPQHLFKDICSIIPEEALTALQAMELNFKERTRVLHQSLSKDKLQAAEAVREATRTFLADALEILKACVLSAGHTDYCYRCDAQCAVDPSCYAGVSAGPIGKRRVVLEVAGSTCIAFSTMGKGEQWSHGSALPCIIWLWSLRKHRPYIVVHECTQFFTEWVLTFVVGDIYTVESLVFCPTDLGMPSQRPRKYSFLRLKSKVDIIPGMSLATTFRYLAFRRLEMSGNAYCSSIPKEMWARFCLERARNLQQPTMGCDLPGREYGLLSKARQRTLRSYLDHIENSEPNKPPFNKRKGAVFVDLSQSPKVVPRISRNAPTLLKSSVLYNLQQQRLVHPVEYLRCLNIPVFSTGAKECGLSKHTYELSTHFLQTLAGNGVNLAAVGSVILYAMSTSVIS